MSKVFLLLAIVKTKLICAKNDIFKYTKNTKKKSPSIIWYICR